MDIDARGDELGVAAEGKLLKNGHEKVEQLLFYPPFGWVVVTIFGSNQPRYFFF